MEELTFRIEAILRRVRGKKNKESNIYKIGKFTFDTQKQILATEGKQTKLTTKNLNYSVYFAHMQMKSCSVTLL